jgi:hypothetical protein
MPPLQVDDLAAAWLTYQRNCWSNGALADLCTKDPEAAWGVLLRILGLTHDDEMLQAIGAGPLEDLLRAHASTLVARVEAEATINAKLRTALASVWLPRSQDPVTARLVAIGCDQLREVPEHMREPIAMIQEALRLAEQRHTERDDA